MEKCPSNYTTCPYFCKQEHQCILQEQRDIDPKEFCDQFVSLSNLYEQYGNSNFVFMNEEGRQ